MGIQLRRNPLRNAIFYTNERGLDGPSHLYVLLLTGLMVVNDAQSARIRALHYCACLRSQKSQDSCILDGSTVHLNCNYRYYLGVLR